MKASTKFGNISIVEKVVSNIRDSFLVKRNYLISTEMRYKPCFNGYTGINRSHKLYNRNIKRSESFLYNVLG